MKSSRCLLCHNTQVIPFLKTTHGWTLVRCSMCGLVQVMPQPTKDAINKLYEHDMPHFAPYESAISVHRKYFEKKIEEILVLLNSHVQKPRLLDVGCALGVLLEVAKAYGIRADGIDVSEDAVTYCRKKGLSANIFDISGLNVKSLRVLPRQVSRQSPQSALSVTQQFPKTMAARCRVPSDASPAEFGMLRQNQYDVITAFEVIEHSYDPVTMVQTMYKLMKPGGIVAITTPNVDTLWRKAMGKSWVGFHHPEHVFFFNPQSLKTLLEKAGFTDIVIKQDTPRLYPLSYFFRRSADYFPLFTSILLPLARMVDALGLVNPIDPWRVMIAYGRKEKR